MKSSRNFRLLCLSMVLAIVLVPVSSYFVSTYFSSEFSWFRPFFSPVDIFVTVTISLVVFTICAVNYLKLEKANEDTAENMQLVIDELKKQLEKNNAERERFELFVQATGDGIWDWNLKENKFYFSHKWKEMLGFADKEFRDNFLEWQNLVHPDDLGKLLMMWSKCTEGETSYSIEYRIKNKNGRYIWVASRTIAVIDDNGDVCRLAGSHTDITDRKEAELKLIDQQKHLENEIAEQTKDLKNANLRLKELASIDKLTGLYNRRAFDKAIKREWNRCKREHKYISLIMLDIDYFKQYNDTFGHLEGDIVLKKLSVALTCTVRRSTDVVARYGGEEFVVILPGTDETQVLSAARKIQNYVDELNIPSVKECEYDHVTFSMGVGTVMPDDSIEWESVLEQVDNALYKAKQDGRNTIVVSPLNVVNLKRPNFH